MPRKNHAVQFSTVAKVLLVSLFLGGSGVGYVLQKGQIRSLRITRDRNAMQIKELDDQRRRVDAALQGVMGKAKILQAIALHKLPLRPTDQRQVFTTVEPATRNQRREIVVADR